ncbi:hypothetical protein C8J57DRAFT_201138 [Mycena rebaudengoi]|nr:hypothetical protein C8J57DRAFT_201138 [Mycena rebaudengoi]
MSEGRAEADTDVLEEGKTVNLPQEAPEKVNIHGPEEGEIFDPEAGIDQRQIFVDDAARGFEPDGHESEHDFQPDESSDEHDEERAVMPIARYVQTSVLLAALEPTFKPVFPPLSEDVWALLLASMAKREPIETCGDAAMGVVVTELVINELRNGNTTSTQCGVIIAALVSNSTFLHILHSRGFHQGSIWVKQPGNAFEVLAGALALSESLQVLKAWAATELMPLISEAILSCIRYNAWVVIP